MAKKDKKKAPEGHPSVRKEDFKPESVKNEQRLSSRNKKPFFSNYDYSEEGSNETSPGGGLYHGRMDKHKSVKDFIEKRRKKNSKTKNAVQVRCIAFMSLGEEKTVRDLGEDIEISPDVSEDLSESISRTMSFLSGMSHDFGTNINESLIESIRDYSGNLALLCNMIINGKSYSEEDTRDAIHDFVGNDE